MDHHGSRNRDWRIRNMKRDWWIIDSSTHDDPSVTFHVPDPTVTIPRLKMIHQSRFMFLILQSRFLDPWWSISHASCSWSSSHDSSTHDDPSVTFHVPDPTVMIPRPMMIHQSRFMFLILRSWFLDPWWSISHVFMFMSLIHGSHLSPAHWLHYTCSPVSWSCMQCCKKTCLFWLVK